MKCFCSSFLIMLVLILLLSPIAYGETSSRVALYDHEPLVINENEIIDAITVMYDASYEFASSRREFNINSINDT